MATKKGCRLTALLHVRSSSLAIGPSQLANSLNYRHIVSNSAEGGTLPAPYYLMLTRPRGLVQSGFLTLLCVVLSVENRPELGSSLANC